MLATRSLQLADLNGLGHVQMSQPQDKCLLSILSSIRLLSTELDEIETPDKQRKWIRRQAIVSSRAL